MIKVHVPATSANCCVGFDCLGMALDWWSTFVFERAHTLWISGCEPQFWTPDNQVVQAFYLTCEYLKVEKPPFHLSIDTTVPSSHGLGSSAMCIVAGIEGANAWFGSKLTKTEILELAIQMEGHPDNVAPAIFGNTIVSFMDDNHKAHIMPISCADWYLLVMIPETMVSTREARKVLPDRISHIQASRQVANALSFIQALQAGNKEVLFQSCKDYLHEPYRASLIPEYERVHDYCQTHQIPMWISGSGSTLIAIDQQKEKLDDLASHVEVPSHPIVISKKGAYVDE